jgi:acetyl esterase/lipase
VASTFRQLTQPPASGVLALAMLAQHRAASPSPRGDILDFAESVDVRVSESVVTDRQVPVVRFGAASLGNDVAPAILYIHGGGYFAGEAIGVPHELIRFAGEHPARIVSVDYRLAPEHRYPVPLGDCLAALRWMQSSPESLCDPRAVLVAGGSAGGGLAAAVTLRAREPWAVPLVGQLLDQPMLDDRTSVGRVDIDEDGHTWTHQNNRVGWAAMLGSEPGAADIPSDAAPARADDLTGLPPTFLSIGSRDIFLDETIAYATRLVAAHVETELHVWNGGFHGFDLFDPEASVSRLSSGARERWLEQILSA